ncbi:MAG TPA: tRNA (adenosine(37)-N6)-threonylcarbamoyltransferase complex dimerization subunit type 1 TsaB [Caulobacteraceae bacterium]
MRLLVLDTCLEACQAAVFADDAPLVVQSEAMARGHQERLGPMVREVMAQAGVAFSDLDRIAVTVGPGSFTGLRVGIAFAKGLALAADVPAVGIGTLEALAAGDAAPGRKTAVIEAGRGGVWLQSFDGQHPLGPPQNLPLELADLAAAGRLVGPSASRLAASGQAAFDLAAPPAAAIARLAAVAPAASPKPLYLRPPDAKPKAR